MRSNLEPPAAPYLAGAAGALALGLLALAATAGNPAIPGCEIAAAKATASLTAIIGDEAVQAQFLGAPLGQALDQLATARRYCAYGWDSEAVTLLANLSGSIRDLRIASATPPP